MMDETGASFARTRAQVDIAMERGCLRFGTYFWSEGFDHRIYDRCKSSITWRTAMPCIGQRTDRRSSGGSK
ncbi:hypothetical protein P6F26_09825 [Roseibacterium sp. SDUM158017]|uniref:hypothetical protein n=1 Tax=Roseicyclus salinarum TaxID=3036773 RepID=UPI002414DF94|nr:hypothetical protein [Roseibacterium sp. SDUM158017]MDG4648742.1 hypothetical protein [Roseibacterium sp. SDUM158017]